MQNFNWELFKNNKIAVVCKNYEEIMDFINKSKYNNICVKNNVLDFIKNNENKDILFDYFDYNDLDCFCDINYYINKNYKIIQWSDYMVNTKEEVQEYILEKEINPIKKQYNLIELSELPNGSKLYFERLNSKIHVYIDNNGILKYEDDNKPLFPSKYNLKATFTLVSFPPKEVSFKEAVEHYSKGGNIKSILDGETKIYEGLKLDGDRALILTTDRILNAKWYIID